MTQLDSMLEITMADTIHQQVQLPAPVDRAYNALIQAEQFAKMTGAAAEISPSVGGAFTCFDGQVIGFNLELVPHQRIIQAWRIGSWDAGVWSIVRFDLSETDSHTELVLDHVGYPADARDHLVSGWHKMYWEPLRQYLS